MLYNANFRGAPFIYLFYHFNFIYLVVPAQGEYDTVGIGIDIYW